MSMSGERRLELERARVEALRLEQVRAECEGLARACDTAIVGVRETAVQQLAADELRQSVADLRDARHQIVEAPDTAHARLVQVLDRIQQSIARAESAARSWQREQTSAVADARQALGQAEAAGPHARDAVSLARQSVELATSGSTQEAMRLAASSRELTRVARTAALDETVRREVVKGLVRTLKAMGFIVAPPQLDAGVVVLEGRLASGRRARFDVSIDGNLAFDLDGYEGRSCATDLEKVETELRDQFGVRLGPPQVVWKNPDRISAGARDLPPGSARRR
jgi:hypothetical protein